MSSASGNILWAVARVSVNANTALNVVSTSTIQSQWNLFLQERGLLSRTDRVVTTKGLMTFYNSIASFMAARIVIVSSSYGTTVRQFFYNGTNGLGYPAVNPGGDNELISGNDITTFTINLNQILNNVVKAMPASATVSTI